MKKLLILIFAGLMAAITSHAQTSLNVQCENLFRMYHDAYLNAADTGARQTAQRLLEQLLDVNVQPGCIANLILAANPSLVHQSLFLGFATEAEKQLGSSISSAGSTNLVSKNFSSRLIGLASEYGALTSSTSGQTTTLSGSLDQLFTAFEAPSKGLFTECAVKIIPGAGCVQSPIVGFLGRISYSASLDLNQPSTVTGTATGSATGATQQVTSTQGGNSFALSQFTTKIFIWAAKPSKQDFLTSVTNSASPYTSQGAVQLKVLRGAFQKANQADLKAWLEKAVTSLLTKSDANLDSELKSQTNDLVKILVAAGSTEKEIVDYALNFAGALATDASAERNLYSKKAWAKPILTAEYDFNTPSNQPTNSTIRLIYGQAFGKWKLTGNLAGSLYDSLPSASIPNAGRLRDVQVGIEGDYPLPNVGSISPTFSGSYYFQDQTSPAILNVTPSSPITGVSFTGLSPNATQVFTQKGQIHVAQIRITLGSSGSGFSVPIAVTGSNRTELISKPRIGAQIGITYDFDSLLK